MDYQELLEQTEEQENKVSEPYAIEYLPSHHRMRHAQTSSVAQHRYNDAQAFARQHFDPQFVQQLESENFLLDAACANDDAEEFKDIERMFVESEASGSYSQDEVEKIFSVWT